MFHILERWLVYPAPQTYASDWETDDFLFEDVYFCGDDSTRLHGWYVPRSQPRAVVLYCHGNGECVPHLTGRLSMLHSRVGVSVFAWDYRNYGRSEGIPHEANIIPDARAAQLWLAAREGIPPQEVVLMGRSLGGAVAVAIAAEFGCRGLVLDRTFSQLTEAAAHLFPWLPVRRFMKNRFASVERIRNYHGPLWQTHGREDSIVPIEHGRKLYDASPSLHKQFVEVPEGNHNGPLPDYCYDALKEFLEGLSSGVAKEQ